MNKSNNKSVVIWQKAPECNCGEEDCSLRNHRLCILCEDKMLYNSHESEQYDTDYSWKIEDIQSGSLIDKIKSTIFGFNNFEAVHVQCNTKEFEEEPKEFEEESKEFVEDIEESNRY